MAPAVEKLWICPYQIHSPLALSSIETNSRQAWLLKGEFSGGKIGYADFHPLPSRTHNPKELLQAGVEKRDGAQFLKSLELMQKDAWARGEKASIFAGKELPRSHYLIQDILSWDFNLSDELWKQGFRRLKIKLGREPQNEKNALLELKHKAPVFKCRLDFNSGNSLEEWQKWESWLCDNFTSSLDFIEDPLPWDYETWSSSRLPLALDLEWNSAEGQCLDFLNRIIWKPALGEPLGRKDLNSKLVVTHIMDHPIGQLGALLWAQENRVESVGGYLNGSLRDSLGFFEELKVQGPKVQAPTGTGWGFDERLSALKWQSF